MAAKIITDNRLDQELAHYKNECELLYRTTQAFMASFQELPARERAQQIKHIQNKIKEIQKFLLTPQAHELTNSGTRFNLDRLKAGFHSFLGRWNKFEKSIG